MYMETELGRSYMDESPMNHWSNSR